MARVLFNQQLDQPQEGSGKGKAVGDSPIIKHIKERLAETHDLQAEISLENERYVHVLRLRYKNITPTIY